jgi:hypothetical protein
MLCLLPVSPSPTLWHFAPLRESFLELLIALKRPRAGHLGLRRQ